MTRTINFEEALALLKERKKVKLNSWKDDVYISIDFSDGCVHLGAMTAPYMFVTSRNGTVPWMPTQIEIMSDEWIEVDEKPIPTVEYKETVEDIFLKSNYLKSNYSFTISDLLEHIQEATEEIKKLIKEEQK